MKRAIKGIIAFTVGTVMIPFSATLMILEILWNKNNTW